MVFVADCVTDCFVVKRNIIKIEEEERIFILPYPRDERSTLFCRRECLSRHQ